MDLASLFGAKEVRVRAGEPLKLALGISGSPPPTVTWTKNGKPVARVTIKLSFNIIDERIYTTISL